MKKIMKLSKIFLLIAMVFSYVSSPISVLANEVASPLMVTLNAVDVDEDGAVDNYELTYKSEDQNDYENEKIYTIELKTTVTYTNGDKEVLSIKNVDVEGSVLNSVESSYTLDNPVSKYYNGEYVLELSIYYEEGTSLYSNEYTYENDYSAPVGLTGKLNGDGVVIEETTTGNYNVTTEGKYTQGLNVLTGALSPNAMYRIVYGDGEEVTYSDVMTGEILRTKELVGTETDLTGKLYGIYSYADSVTFEEVTGNETDGYTRKEVYTYNYDATLNYGTDNDESFENMYSSYGVTFVDGYMGVTAKGLWNAETVITVEELAEVLVDTGITLSVTDGTSEEEVLTGEVKNGYVVSFTNGATASYVVAVIGDADLDNDFDSDDLTMVMEGYLNEESMPSMDFTSSQVEEGQSPVEEEIGTITFEDITVVNELLKGENADFTEKEIGTVTVVLGELPELVYLGESFDVEVLVSSEVVEELIDGIDATVSCTNLKLEDTSYVEFNSLLNGVSNTDGRLVAVGSEGLSNDMVVLTLTFTATAEGTGIISVSGNVYRFLSNSEFELTGEIEIERKISSNSYLSSLTPSVGSFDVNFDKDVTVYTLTVPYNTESVILSGSLEDVYSTVDGFIEYELTENKTTAIITVTAEDGTTKVYTVYIIKEVAPAPKPVVNYYSSNSYLKTLEIEGYDLEFNKYTDEYRITVNNDVLSLDITALAEHAKARVEITGNGDFKEGENTVTITVIAQNGSTREYKLIVTKEEKQVVADVNDSSNTAEKIVIIVLIILVVLGLLYLIFKKDDEEKEEVKNPVKRDESIDSKNDNRKNKNTTNNKKNSRNNNKNRKK